jgi:antitoxin (DNA-binding transcriptional repressor) of toxin-antitoxin stability system
MLLPDRMRHQAAMMGILIRNGSESMMPTATVEEIQAKLPELIDKLLPGEEITIVRQGKTLAQMKKTLPTTATPETGCYAKTEFWMAPDFDAPLADFKDYME